VESDLAEAIDAYHGATNAFVRGDPEPQKRLYSRGDDATLANPLGPPARGRTEVEALLDRAASAVRDGEPILYERISEYATPDLAYIVEFERVRAKFAGSRELQPASLRVTTIFRREDGGWKIAHRHADPITGPRPVESVLEP
jgi:ketosteroid isomerase-like protein